MTGSGQIDAERAFSRARRGRRLAALAGLMRRDGGGRLAVLDERSLRRVRPERGIREIPVQDITATLEPTRSRLFDGRFRPAALAQVRWQRIWLAEHCGAVLPPIEVVRVGDRYAVRDGHHRVSVARARGALTIDAQIDAVA